MSPITVVSSRAQQPLTVNAIVKDPLWIPERIVALTQNQFITDRILRDAGTPAGGAIAYRASSPIFADQQSAIVAEGTEIPVVTVSRGDLTSKPTAKHGLGLIITREMQSRNQLGEVDRQLNVVSNTIIRDIDGALFAVLQSAVTQTRVATAAWSSTSAATIRRDINAARLLVRQAALAAQANNWFGYDADTLVLNPVDESNLLDSPEFLALLFGQVNPSDIASLDGRTILDLTIMVSRAAPQGTPLVVQRNTIGGYADEWPLESTALYPIQETQSYRSDTTRSTVGFVDQPLAGCWITGA